MVGLFILCYSNFTCPSKNKEVIQFCLFSCGIPVALSRFWIIQTVWAGKIFSIFDIKALFKLNKNSLLILKKENELRLIAFFCARDSFYCTDIFLKKKKKLLLTYSWFTMLCWVFFWPHPVACGISVPHPGTKSAPPALEGRVLTTRPPGKVLVTQAYPTLWPHGLWPARLLCPWNSPGKNTGVGSHFVLQGIFPTQGLNSCFLHWQAFFTLFHIFLIFFK